MSVLDSVEELFLRILTIINKDSEVINRNLEIIFTFLKAV